MKVSYNAEDVLVFNKDEVSELTHKHMQQQPMRADETTLAYTARCFGLATAEIWLDEMTKLVDRMVTEKKKNARPSLSIVRPRTHPPDDCA